MPVSTNILMGLCPRQAAQFTTGRKTCSNVGMTRSISVMVNSAGRVGFVVEMPIQSRPALGGGKMDALDISNAAMQGIATYMEWKKEFIADFQESMMKGQIKQAFAMMPPHMKEWLKKNDPKGYEMAMSMIGGPNAKR